MLFVKRYHRWEKDQLRRRVGRLLSVQGNFAKENQGCGETFISFTVHCTGCPGEKRRNPIVSVIGVDAGSFLPTNLSTLRALQHQWPIGEWPDHSNGSVKQSQLRPRPAVRRAKTVSDCRPECHRLASDRRDRTQAMLPSQSGKPFGSPRLCNRSPQIRSRL